MKKTPFYSMLLFILLTANANAMNFAKKWTRTCRQRKEHQKLGEPILYNQMEDSHERKSYDNCDLVEFGIIQKIPYRPMRDAIEINFFSACIRCGMCLAIAEKINQTLLAVEEEMPSNTCLNDTETVLLLRTICDYSFKYYNLREIDGERFISDDVPGSIVLITTADGLWGSELRDLCHSYLDEVGEVKLYEYWQKWCRREGNYLDMKTILCRDFISSLRDCRRVEDVHA